MFRFYKLYSLYMNNSRVFGEPEWCVCEKLPRALVHVPVNRFNTCEVCFLSRRPRSLLSGSSDEEEKQDAERQQMLLQRRRAEEAAQRNKAARFKLPAKGKKPQAKSNGSRNNAKSDGMARTAGGGIGGIGEAGDGFPEDPTGKLSPKPRKLVGRHVDRRQEPSAPPPSSPSPPPAPSGSPREEMHFNFGRKKVKKLTPLQGPITDPSGGAISKVYGYSWGPLNIHLSGPQAPLSSVHNKDNVQDEDLGSSKSQGKYTDSQLATQFPPFEEYDGPSEDALVVDEARRMLSRPNSLYMDQRPDLPNNRIGNYGSSLGRFWMASHTVPAAPAPKPASDKSPQSEEKEADTKEGCDTSSTSSVQADGAEEAGKSEEEAVKKTGISEYEEILENLGLMKLSDEKEETTVDELANDNVDSANKAMTDEDYSEVLSREGSVDSEERSEECFVKRILEAKFSTCVRNYEEKNHRTRTRTEVYPQVLSGDQRAANKEPIRIGGPLPKRSEEKMITVRERNLEAKSSINVRNHAEFIRIGGPLVKRSEEKMITVKERNLEAKSSTNVRNYAEFIRIGGPLVKRSEEKLNTEIYGAKSSSPRNLKKSESTKIPKLNYTSEQVSPVPLKKTRFEDMPIMANPFYRQPIAPTKPLPKRQVGVPPVAKKPAKGASRIVPPVTRKQKPEDRKLVTGNVKAFETLYQISGDLPKPQMASFDRQLAGNLTESYVEAVYISDFRKPDVDLGDLKGSCRSETPKPHVRSTRNIKTFHSIHHMDESLPRSKMASFDKHLMGTLFESYIPNQPVMPHLDHSEVVPKNLEDSSRDYSHEVEKTPMPQVATPKEPVSFIQKAKTIRCGKRLSESKSLTCTKCGHNAKNHKENRKLEKSVSDTSTKLKFTPKKRRVCHVISAASGRSRKPEIMQMKMEKFTWEDLLLVPTNIASPVLGTGNIQILESIYYICCVIPKSQTASFVSLLVGQLSKTYIRNQPVMSIFEFRIPDVDPNELQFCSQDKSHKVEDKSAASRAKSPIVSPEKPDRSNLKPKRKAKTVWPDWTSGELPEAFVRQRKSLIQKEVVTRIIYDPGSSQSESSEETTLRHRKSKSKTMKLMEETKWKRYDQVDELEIMHKRSSNKPAAEPELGSETNEDSGNQTERAELYEFRLSMTPTVSKEYSFTKKVDMTALHEDKASKSKVTLKSNTKNDMKEGQVEKQKPQKFSEIFSTDSDAPPEPKLTQKSTVYPGLPAPNWQVVSLEKAKARLSTGREKECHCPIYKCGDSLTPKTLTTHFKRDHRNKSEETYHQVVEGLPTQFSFNCENMTNGNTFVTLLLYSNIRRDTPRRSSPVRYHPLVLLAAPDRMQNGLAGIFFWVVGYPTEAKLSIKLSVSYPLELKGLTKIIHPRDISRKQNPQRFGPDAKDHLLFQVLSSKKPSHVQIGLAMEKPKPKFQVHFRHPAAVFVGGLASLAYVMLRWMSYMIIILSGFTVIIGLTIPRHAWLWLNSLLNQYHIERQFKDEL